MFSSRVPSGLEPNVMSRALRAAHAASRPLLDLTLTNPTKAGFVYPDALLASLNASDARAYDPAPLGSRRAREAVADDYARRGINVDPDCIVLTSSTSEAYSLIFKLLCEPSGDQVLTPAPSYPLFEHLTRLDGVSAVQYSLEYHGRWTIAPGSIEAAWSPRARAVLAVSPNNPTGSCLLPTELDALSSLCASRGMALVLDEVFAEYLLDADPGPRAPTFARSATVGKPDPEFKCLSFRLGGLSKSVGLPQVKLGWMTVEGPREDVAAALERLEFICDAYLSVATPVQNAARTLLAHGASVRDQITTRVRTNYEHLRRYVAGHPALEVLAADAGWSAVLRVPARTTEEELVLELLEQDAVVVHPGYFFDFPHEAMLVLSLLPPAAVFQEGVSRIIRRLG